MVEPYTTELIEYLVRDIIFRLSPEMQSNMMPHYIEELWAAVDLLALLCEAYEQSCEIDIEFIRAWRTTTLKIVQSFIDGGFPWSDALQALTGVFDHLIAVSEKYPASSELEDMS